MDVPCLDCRTLWKLLCGNTTQRVALLEEDLPVISNFEPGTVPHKRRRTAATFALEDAHTPLTQSAPTPQQVDSMIEAVDNTLILGEPLAQFPASTAVVGCGSPQGFSAA